MRTMRGANNRFVLHSICNFRMRRASASISRESHFSKLARPILSRAASTRSVMAFPFRGDGGRAHAAVGGTFNHIGGLAPSTSLHAQRGRGSGLQYVLAFAAARGCAAPPL